MVSMCGVPSVLVEEEQQEDEDETKIKIDLYIVK